MGHGDQRGPSARLRASGIRLLGQAHQRGIRVIAGLVVNHTSDQQAWFASARRGRASRWRDYLAKHPGLPDNPLLGEEVPRLGGVTTDWLHQDHRAWLPSGERADHETAAVQAADPASPLSATRRLIAARRSLGIEPEKPAGWLETELLVAYRRGDVLAAANLGDDPAAFDPGPGNWQVAFDTDYLPSGEPGKGCRALRPELAVRRPSSLEGAHRA